MPGFEQVRIEGFKDLKRELRDIDKRLPRELGKASKEASDLIARKAKSKAKSLGGVAAHAAPSIKAVAAQMAAKITIGGPKNPEGLGAEFGGRGRPTTQQFEPHLGTKGYALFPTIRATREEFIDVFEARVDDVMRRAFPN